MAKKSPHLRPADVNVDEQDRPHIDHLSGNSPWAADQSIVAIKKKFTDLVIWADNLVRVRDGEEGPRPILVEVDHLVEMGTLSAVHRKFDKRMNEWVPIDLPRRIAQMILARRHWPEIPRLAGIVHAPVCTPVGKLIENPGLDPETWLYVASAAADLPGYSRPQWKHPRVEGKSKGIQALEILLGLTGEFPFVSDADRAAFIAAILAGLLRTLLPSCPWFCITAPAPGTGKTLLAEMVAMIVNGRRPAVFSLGGDEAETEKRLGGIFLSGASVAIADNIETTMGGVLPCQVSSQPEILIRPLGGSQMVSVSTRVLMLATGNNLAVVGDLKRRVFLVRLDAKHERPEQRKFEENILDVVKSRRGEFVRAALHITQAYIEAGAPDVKAAPFGSFDDFDRMVRRPLIWLGMPDPLSAAESLRDMDPDLETMRTMFEAWHALFGSDAVTAAEVVDRGMEYQTLSQRHANPELYDALQVACSEKPNTRRLGGWLKRHRDRIIDGFQLVMAGHDGHAKVGRWRVQKLVA